MTIKEPPDKQHYLSTLIYNAMLAFNKALSERSLPTESVSILSADNWRYEMFSRPNFHNAQFDYQTDNLSIPAAKLLLDYLWDIKSHMNLKSDIGTIDRSSDISKFHQVVVGPLYPLWNEDSIRSLSATGHWVPWKVADERIAQLAKDVAAFVLGKGAKIKITIPLRGVMLGGIRVIDLGDGVVIRELDKLDQVVYMHSIDGMHGRRDFFRHMHYTCHLEIVANEKAIFKDGRRDYSASGHQELAEHISSIVGAVKWAITQATDPTQLIGELPTLVTTWPGNLGFSPIHREQMDRLGHGNVTLDEKNGQSVANLLKMLKDAKEIYSDLADVVWMFDRAMLAVLPRDALLESAIGLERLLVNGNGENARRFRTYGAALIGDDEPIKTAAIFSKIYTLRSKAAHGSNSNLEQKKFEILSVTARSYLATALTNVVHLILSKKIIPEGKADNASLSISIERYLTLQIYETTKLDLSHAKNPKAEYMI